MSSRECKYGKLDSSGHIKTSTVKQLYQMIYDTVRILEANDITFWAEGNTLMGAVHNKGILPWDGDIDLGVIHRDKQKLLKLLPLFTKCGYSMIESQFSYKLFNRKRKKIKGCNYSFPFLEFFFYQNRGKIFILSPKEARQKCPKSYYKQSELLPLQLHPFGDFLIPIPHNSEVILDRKYGKKWKSQGDQPAKPTKVTKRRCLGNMSISLKAMKKKIPIRGQSSICLPSETSDCQPRLGGETMAVFVINCDIHKTRLKKFRKFAKAAKLPFCREVCVNGKAFSRNLLCNMVAKGLVDKTNMTPIEVAICYSHINTWQRFVDSCKDYALILEDDAEVHKDFKKMLNKTLNALHKAGEKFDILFLWNGDWAETWGVTTEEVLRVDDKINVIRETEYFNAGAVAYVLTSNFAKFLVKNAFPIERPIDIYIGEQVEKKGGQALSIEMREYRSKKIQGTCYLSPFFRGINWICGGERGVGASTQNYDVTMVKNLDCKK